MSKYTVEDTTLTGLANAARGFTHTDAAMTLAQISAAMSNYAWRFMGDGAELLNGNLYSKTTKLSATDFASWTPSTTAKDIIASTTLSPTYDATDMLTYEYYLVWKCYSQIVSAASATKKALPLMAAAYQVQNIFRRCGSLTAIGNGTPLTNVCNNLLASTFLKYYGTTTGTITYTYAASYGIYFTPTAATFSNATSDTPKITIKTPKVSARCSTTYMSTTNAGLIDQDKTEITIKGELWRARAPGALRSIYDSLYPIINGGV